MKHTKTPWRFTGVTKDVHDQFCSTGLVSKGGVVAKAGECQWTGLIVFDKKEDMDFFLHAANNHDRLVKMLKEVTPDLFPDLTDRVNKLLRAMGEIDG